MSDVPRDFVGGVWDGQTRVCNIDATAQVIGVPIVGSKPEQPAILWSGYLLRGDDFICIVTGTRDECEHEIAKKVSA